MKAEGVVLVFWVLAFGVVCMTIGYEISSREWKRAAYNAGHGTYVVDENGHSEFKWRPACR